MTDFFPRAGRAPGRPVPAPVSGAPTGPGPPAPRPAVAVRALARGPWRGAQSPAVEPARARRRRSSFVRQTAVRMLRQVGRPGHELPAYTLHNQCTVNCTQTVCTVGNKTRNHFFVPYLEESQTTLHYFVVVIIIK